MDISVLIDGGWTGLIAVLFAGAGLIASLGLGSGGAGGPMCVFGVRYRAFLAALIWVLGREFLPAALLRKIPFALIVPGVDVALLLALLAVLVRGLSASFRADWNWRAGLRQYLFFLLPAIACDLVYQDVKVFPPDFWMLASVEAALLLPFFLRMGYEERRVGD